MTYHCTRIPKILLPKGGTDLSKWSVIACDQYTSQPDYWEETEQIVGNAPSTLRLTLPEIYLDADNIKERVDQIHDTMQTYLSHDILQELPKGIILTERYSGNACPRRGIVLSVDLETYDYHSGSQSLIRPTEQTVVERIPPRLKVRQGASIELPHIMLLIDDPEKKIIEPLFTNLEHYEEVYCTDLIQNGGHLNGWFIPQGSVTDTLEKHLDSLCDRNTFNQKYHCTDKQALLSFAVGDGNHSMATAKAYWEDLKSTLPPEAQSDHPARYALVELVNIHDESLIIRPIHRVLFGVDTNTVLESLIQFYQSSGCKAYLTDTNVSHAHCFPYFSASKCGILAVESPKWAIPAATLQTGLDHYLTNIQTVKIDYIHGANVTKSLSSQAGNLGFLLPDITKNDIFRGVIFDGVLPRKTFSMGEAHEKRYYMEAKKII